MAPLLRRASGGGRRRFARDARAFRIVTDPSMNGANGGCRSSGASANPGLWWAVKLKERARSRACTDASRSESRAPLSHSALHWLGDTSQPTQKMAAFERPTSLLPVPRSQKSSVVISVVATRDPLCCAMEALCEKDTSHFSPRHEPQLAGGLLHRGRWRSRPARSKSSKS